MQQSSPEQVTERILKTAKKFGADLVGITSVAQLTTAPSFLLAPKMADAGKGIGSREGKMELAPGEVNWPERAKSVVVIAVSHPEDRPELDWWYGRKSPSGNKQLMDTAKQLCEWLETDMDIRTVHLPYHVEHGGIYLKDSAVMAGIGCIGKNNMVVTPEFGPRVRLRALTLDRELPATGPIDFNPCEKCAMYCRKACPQTAFKKHQFRDNPLALDFWPGRTGHYSRPTCNVQMEKDNDQARETRVDGFESPVKIVKYCRVCEFACPVGKPES
ncbi:MAG: epoxyqueuosine reductase [Desulfobacterales bacterium]|nr:epoxyqueuosine reductase [Desulfobacterales bacterium]